MAKIDRTVGVKELAEWLGITPRSIQLHKADGMPGDGRGQYPLRACVAWYCDRLRTATQRSDGELSDEKRKLTRAQRLRAELELDTRRGELLEADEVIRVLSEIAGIVASGLDSLAPRVSGRVADMTDPAAIQRLLFDEARAIRSSLSTSIQLIAGDHGSGKDIKPTTRPKRGPVGRSKSHPAP